MVCWVNGRLRSGMAATILLIDRQVVIGQYPLTAIGYIPKLAVLPEVEFGVGLGLEVEFGSSWIDPGATCSDVEDGNLTVSMPTLDTSIEGLMWLVYECSDTDGNTVKGYRRIFVRDSWAPMLSVDGNLNMSVEEGSTWSDPGATCNDHGRTMSLQGPSYLLFDTYYQDERIYRPAANLWRRVVQTSKPGRYSIQYNCKDPANNLAVAWRTVWVIDRTPPVLKMHGAQSPTVHVGERWMDPGAECVDAVNGTLPVTTHGTVNSQKALQMGKYVVEYSCRDAAGNIAAVTRVVTVMFAARAWRIAPIGVVATDWFVRNLALFEDTACTRRLDIVTQRAGRLSANGHAFSSPPGASTRADGAFVRWTPQGPGASVGWNSGHRCDVGLTCYIGFEFDRPAVAGCAILEQGTAPGTYAEILRLQWQEQLGDASPWRDIGRAGRNHGGELTGGPVTIRGSSAWQVR